MNATILKSQEDDSVNFRFKGNFPGYFEAGYARESPDCFAVYLSSQSGCSQACRICRLTATDRTEYKNADAAAYAIQAELALDWYQKNSPTAKIVNFNFMARGEPFDNQSFGENTLSNLARTAKNRQKNLSPQFFISTIFPDGIRKINLAETFSVINPCICYSFYSTDEVFRKKWIPRTVPAREACRILADYQNITGKIVRINWILIRGENDREADAVRICDEIIFSGLRVDVNIVCRNPHSPFPVQNLGLFKETIRRNAVILRQLLPLAKIELIPG